MKTIFHKITDRNSFKRISFFYMLLAISFLVISCFDRGKPIQTIPVSSAPLSDSINFSGNQDISIVGRELFRCFRGQKNKQYLQHFFPDSAAVATMYNISGHSPKTATETDSIVTEARKSLLDNFRQAGEGGIMVNVDWKTAEMDRMMVQDMEDDVLHGKNLFIYGHSGDIKFKISCKCMNLGGKWFIGESIKFLKY